MDRDELKKHAQKNIDDDLDEDDILSKNIHMDFPPGLFHRICIQGNNFVVDLYTPVIKDGIDFLQLRDAALYLALFSKDDDVQHIVKKQILESLNNPVKE